jgi:hypothetical protein
LGIFLNTNTVVAKTANYTILNYDNEILCDSSGGAFSLTLPSPALLTGKVFSIKDTKGTAQTNNITIIPHAGEMIEGLASNYLFQTNFGSLNLKSDGTNWWLV